MRTETLTWYTPAERLPDALERVLVIDEEGTAEAFFDGSGWVGCSDPVRGAVREWAQMPGGTQC